MHKDYYEAILQIRPKKSSLLDFVRSEASKLNTTIAREISKDFGFDIYLSSKKSALKIGKQLNKKFKGSLTVTKSLYSKDRQTSKLVYRMTIAFRLK